MATDEDFDLDYRRSTVAKIHESFRSIGDGLSSLRKYVFVGIGAIVVFCACIFGLTVASFEYTKEFSPSSESVMTNVHTGAAIATFGATASTSSVDDLFNSDSIWVKTQTGSTQFKILGVEIPEESDSEVPLPATVYTIKGAYSVEKDGRIYPVIIDSEDSEDSEESEDSEDAPERKLLGIERSPTLCWIFPHLCLGGGGAGGSFGRHLNGAGPPQYRNAHLACRAIRREINFRGSSRTIPNVFPAGTDEHMYLLACNKNYATQLNHNSGRHRQLQGAGGGRRGPWWLCILTPLCGQGAGGSFGRHLSEERELQGGGANWICFIFPYMCGNGAGGSFGRKLTSITDYVPKDFQPLGTVSPMEPGFCCLMCGNASPAYEKLNRCRSPPTLKLSTKALNNKGKFDKMGDAGGYTVGDAIRNNDMIIDASRECMGPAQQKTYDAVMSVWFVKEQQFVGDVEEDHQISNIDYYNPCRICGIGSNKLGVGASVCGSSGSRQSSYGVGSGSY